MKNYLTESLGTFFLVLVIGLAVSSGSEFAPIAIGTILMVMVYAWGHISGGHYNPAVTLWLTIAWKSPVKEAIPYMISQLIGAFVAAAVSYILVGQNLIVAPASSSIQAILAEVIFTFALVYVVLNVACTKATEGNSYYGLAIWFTVMASAYAAWGISGWAFNPAVAAGPQLFDLIMGGTSLSNIWIYLIACFGGWTLAALRYNMINDKK
jgi:aquaporin Z